MRILGSRFLDIPKNQKLDKKMPTEVKSEVSKVTVYTDRAMITRVASTFLEKNTTSLQIVNLPINLREDSLRISGSGKKAMTILDFKVSEQQFKEVPEAALRTLEEEKQRFHDQIAALRDEIAATEHQKAFLKEISVGKSRHISKDLDIQRPLLDDWKAVLEFLGKEEREINTNRRDMELKIRKIEADIRMIEAELKKYANVRSKTRKIVTIEVELADEGEFTFELSYIINEANWQPMYDARVDSRNKKVGIRYYGLVSQRTGEDWKGVDVLLSTARPQLGGNAPDLGAWWVAPYVAPSYNYPVAASVAAPAPRGGMMKKKDMARLGSGEMDMELDAVMMEEAQMPSVVAQASVEAGQGASVVFRTSGRGDVPGDGSHSKLLIMDDEFGNHFRYLTVPKLAEHVYLTAEITNSTEFPLLPGKISIFLDGSFVGHSQLSDLVTTGEKFVLHLGVDESIKVKRKLQKRKGDEKGLFSRSKVEEYSYLITLESQRDSAEEVIVRDHLPVSTDEKIKVETTLLKPSENPEKDKDKLANGTVEWKVQLEPRTTAKLELAFTVSYPKDLEVTGL
jgi:uncharacterized protein (TIGR02231 family)